MPTTHVTDSYRTGYAEGRRTARHLVCGLAESVTYRDAIANLEVSYAGERGWDSFRAYWQGMKRGIRNHEGESASQVVTDARARRR